MRNLILWDMISLDGHFSGPDGGLDWFAVDEDLEKYIQDVNSSVGTVLFGRATYEGMRDFWSSQEGEIAEFMTAVPKVVFSTTLASADWDNSTLVRDDVPEEIARLKRQPGKDIFVFGSADLSATLIEHGLVDEYRIGINPILLGSGVPFFKGRTERLPLTLVDLRQFGSGVVILHYRPAGNA